MSFRTPPQRLCPGCGTSTDDATTRCDGCGYGLRAQLESSQGESAHRTLFPSKKPNVEARLEREFRCPHCRSFGAKVSRSGNFSTQGLGGGLASCRFCGAVQFFDLGVFDASPGVRWDLIDD